MGHMGQECVPPERATVMLSVSQTYAKGATKRQRGLVRQPAMPKGSMCSGIRRKAHVKKKENGLLTFVSSPICPLLPSSLASRTAPPSNTLTVVCFPFVFPLHTNSLSPSLKSRLYNLRHSLPSLALLRKASRQMLRFNALIWLAVSSSVSLILIHLVPSKTLWSNLGKLALAQTNRHLWDSTDFFSFFYTEAKIFLLIIYIVKEGAA